MIFQVEEKAFTLLKIGGPWPPAPPPPPPGSVGPDIDRMIEARKPGIVLLDKRGKELKMIDITVPGDSRMKEKEIKKIEKHQMLR